MRITRKLVLWLTIAAVLVLGANAVLRVRRENALFESDMRADDARIGRGFSAAVELAWRLDGEAGARAFIRSIDLRDPDFTIRWIGERDAILSPAQRTSLDAGEIVTVRRAGAHGGVQLTYVPLRIGTAHAGFLELSESLATEKAYIHATVRNTVLSTLLLIGISVVAAFGLGTLLIGRPIRLLAAKARRVGEGHLGDPLALGQEDELGDLAREINLMCDNLAAARDQIEYESRARLAAVEQLRHADRLMTVGKLAAGVAHELGTPLNVVGGRAQMIASGEMIGDEVKDSARIIWEQTKRMTGIIRQLLDFARSGRPERVAVDLRNLAREAATLLAAMARKVGATIDVAVPEVAVTVQANEGLLQQAVLNLVVNAIQASPSGGRVELEVAREAATPPAEHGGKPGAYLALRVRDHGGGMDAETAARVFEPFFTTKGVGEGTGLGLSVTYGIVRDHGGWIDLVSQPGHGACFTIYLPTPGDSA